MKLNKRFIKFHEIDNNRYYLLPFDDELHIATESILTFEKKFLFFKKKETLTQGLKLLQLTGPILMLFNSIISADVDKEDKEFKDMTTYKKVDNVALRKDIEYSYKSVLDNQIDLIKADFDKWKDDFIANSEDNLQEISNVISVNSQRLDRNIQTIKENNILNFLSFKWKSGENLIIKKMLDNNMEFLYSQKIGTGYKIYYLYDLDIFGTVTIYKVQCVKDIVKSIDTFIYNREIIQEMLACMVNNNL